MQERMLWISFLEGNLLNNSQNSLTLTLFFNLSFRGWTTLVNDSLISNVLSLVVFSFTVLTSIVGASFALFWGDYFSHMCNIPVNSIWMACVIIGGITGFLSCSALVTVIDSAVAMIYVCFAEHPVALQVSCVCFLVMYHPLFTHSSLGHTST